MKAKRNFYNLIKEDAIGFKRIKKITEDDRGQQRMNKNELGIKGKTEEERG